MNLVICVNFLLKWRKQEGFDLVLDQNNNFIVVLVDLHPLHSFLFFKLDFNVVLTLLLADHLDLLHFYLFSDLLFLLRVLHLFAAFFLGLSGLFVDLLRSSDWQFLLEIQSLEDNGFFFLRFDLEFNMVLSHSSIEKQVCTLAVLSLVPIIIIIVGEGSSEALSFNIGRIEGIH